jgi:hypothetical protein
MKIILLIHQWIPQGIAHKSLKTALLLLTIAFSFNVSAQDTIRKKKSASGNLVFSLGVAPGLPLLNNRYAGTFERGQQIEVFYEKSYFPPKVMLQAGHTLGNQFQLSVEAYWQGLQNSGFSVYDSWTDTASMLFVEKLDSFRIRTNVIGCAAELRYFTDKAPVGFYLSGSVSLSHLVGDIYPIYRMSITDPSSGLTNSAEESKDPGISTLNTFGCSIGIGFVSSSAKNATFDIGLRGSFFLNKYLIAEDPNEEDYDYRTEIDSYFPYIMNGNIQSTNAFEIYVRIGFFH